MSTLREAIDQTRQMDDTSLRDALLASLKIREAASIQAANRGIKDHHPLLSVEDQALHIVYNERGLPPLSTSMGASKSISK